MYFARPFFCHPATGASESRSAFTLIELLVAMTVIAVLAGLLLPNLAAARHTAKTAVCASNLRFLGMATSMYLDANNEYFWRYYSTVNAPPAPAAGRLWWFGFELNGPGMGSNRPLDKTQSPLAPYIANLDDRMQCPEFPYWDGNYFPKFADHAASYGYNLNLGPVAGATATRTGFADRLSNVFVFADGIFFDTNPGFMEGFYIAWTPNTASLSGYAHFRHKNCAQMVMLDGHVDSQPPGGPLHSSTLGDAPCGNLYAPDGTNAIYGY